mmetsp:Transcript_15212/g.41862  ORF Transcript_15212/g.41862 Transcript_15212/m.41862 type:complete len:258 (+) Transcript_15212:723-1496(+)
MVYVHDFPHPHVGQLVARRHARRRPDVRALRPQVHDPVHVGPAVHSVRVVQLDHGALRRERAGVGQAEEAALDRFGAGPRRAAVARAGLQVHRAAGHRRAAWDPAQLAAVVEHEPPLRLRLRLGGGARGRVAAGVRQHRDRRQHHPANVRRGVVRPQGAQVAQRPRGADGGPERTLRRPRRRPQRLRRHRRAHRGPHEVEKRRLRQERRRRNGSRHPRHFQAVERHGRGDSRSRGDGFQRARHRSAPQPRAAVAAPQ